ncbi:MAG: hypothetical protein WA857_16640 [Candidatus Acidiferrum sp.]
MQTPQAWGWEILAGLLGLLEGKRARRKLLAEKQDFPSGVDAKMR